MDRHRPYRRHRWEIKKIVIEQTLAHTGGNKQQAANLLGITREGLRKKLLRMEK